MTQATPRPPRAARPARPPVPALPGMDALDRTHAAMLATLADIGRLLDHVDDNGPDEAAREMAARIHAFFEAEARAHHAQEDRVVFPPLLAEGDEELVHHVRRLQQDHGWLEEDWREIGPQIEAIARGYNWYDLPMLRQALPVFTQLYQEHIALEESLVYPAARRSQQSLAAGEARRKAGEA